jgi:hypothetical protein
MSGSITGKRHCRPRRGRSRDRDLVCHATLRVVRGLPSLRDDDVARQVEAAFRRGCAREGMRIV